MELALSQLFKPHVYHREIINTSNRIPTTTTNTAIDNFFSICGELNQEFKRLIIKEYTQRAEISSPNEIKPLAELRKYLQVADLAKIAHMMGTNLFLYDEQGYISVKIELENINPGLNNQYTAVIHDRPAKGFLPLLVSFGRIVDEYRSTFSQPASRLRIHSISPCIIPSPIFHRLARIKAEAELMPTNYTIGASQIVITKFIHNFVPDNNVELTNILDQFNNFRSTVECIVEDYDNSHLNDDFRRLRIPKTSVVLTDDSLIKNMVNSDLATHVIRDSWLTRVYLSAKRRQDKGELKTVFSNLSSDISKELKNNLFGFNDFRQNIQEMDIMARRILELCNDFGHKELACNVLYDIALNDEHFRTVINMMGLSVGQIENVIVNDDTNAAALEINSIYNDMDILPQSTHDITQLAVTKSDLSWPINNFSDTIDSLNRFCQATQKFYKPAAFGQGIRTLNTNTVRVPKLRTINVGYPESGNIMLHYDDKDIRNHILGKALPNNVYLHNSALGDKLILKGFQFILTVNNFDINNPKDSDTHRSSCSLLVYRSLDMENTYLIIWAWTSMLPTNLRPWWIFNFNPVDRNYNVIDSNLCLNYLMKCNSEWWSDLGMYIFETGDNFANLDGYNYGNSKLIDIITIQNALFRNEDWSSDTPYTLTLIQPFLGVVNNAWTFAPPQIVNRFWPKGILLYGTILDEFVINLQNTMIELNIDNTPDPRECELISKYILKCLNLNKNSVEIHVDNFYNSILNRPWSEKSIHNKLLERFIDITNLVNPYYTKPGDLHCAIQPEMETKPICTLSFAHAAKSDSVLLNPEELPLYVTDNDNAICEDLDCGENHRIFGFTLRCGRTFYTSDPAFMISFDGVTELNLHSCCHDLYINK